MGSMASQITSLTIVYSTVYSAADQRKHQSSASLAFVRGIHRGPGNSHAQMASNVENVSIWWHHHAFYWQYISECLGDVVTLEEQQAITQHKIDGHLQKQWVKPCDAEAGIFQEY